MNKAIAFKSLSVPAAAVIAALASPAWADATPECNNGVAAGTTECGSDSTVTSQSPQGTAVGNNAFVAGTSPNGTAIGASAIVNNVSLSTTIDTTPVAAILGGTSVGAYSRVGGDDGVALGNFAVVGVRNSFAVVNGGTALGAGTLAGADNATAVGSRAQALGELSTAFGQGATTNSANSVAIGAGSVADVADTVSFGTAGGERTLVNVAAGVDATDAVNFGQLTATNLAVSANTSAITAEAGTRAAADTALQGNISAEIADRQAAVQLVNNRVAQEEIARAALAGQLITESNTRAAAEFAQQTQINSLGTRVDQLETQFSRLDKHVSSSTAVAVAMSGNAFLPNMKFNLTANVATYQGSQAGAIQIGALVSDHVAINAGVATGFSSYGGTAGRVGMTIGW